MKLCQVITLIIAICIFFILQAAPKTHDSIPIRHQLIQYVLKRTKEIIFGNNLKCLQYHVSLRIVSLFGVLLFI